MMKTAIIKSLRDADKEVRSASRSAFQAFAQVFHEEAKKSLREMDPEDKQRLQDLFLPVQPVKTGSLIPSSAVKATPHHARTVSFHPSTTIQKSFAPPPTTIRKPLQAISLNTNTPSRKLTKENFGLTTVQRTEKKTKMTPSERILRCLVDCFGPGESDAISSKRIIAMREMAAIFVSQPKELSLSDYTSYIHRIEICVKSIDHKVASAGMDAFGTFMYALRSCGYLDYLSMDMLNTAFPVALKRTRSEDIVLREAAKRACEACVDICPHPSLLSVVVAFRRTFQEEIVLEIFVSVTREHAEMKRLNNSTNTADETFISEQADENEVLIAE
jgi:hypothetical protein